MGRTSPGRARGAYALPTVRPTPDGNLLLRQVPENLDRAWVAITSEPRRTDQRQHRLKGSLGVIKVGGAALEQWQYEVTSGGRLWYAISDEDRVLWLTRAGPGHPKRTDRGGRR